MLLIGCNKTEEVNMNGKNVLMVIAPENFKDEEYFIPRGILESNKVGVKTVSSKLEASSVNGKKIRVDILLNEASLEDYDGVIFVGGPGASVYFNDARAQELAKEGFNNNKVIGAICIAPSILANAGILSGKKATSFPSEKSNLERKGVRYSNEDVIRDGKIVTANGPNAARKFGETIIKTLEEL